jgi:hypothetical protein
LSGPWHVSVLPSPPTLRPCTDRQRSPKTSSTS